jgi:hypothetical protein
VRDREKGKRNFCLFCFVFPLLLPKKQLVGRAISNQQARVVAAVTRSGSRDEY